MTTKPFDPTAPERYHAIYCNCTHLNLPYRLDYEWPWGLFSMEFTEADLKLVIAHLNFKKLRGQPVRSFLFRNFISGPNSLAFFAEDRAEALAMARQTHSRPDPGRAQVMRQSGRMEPVKDNVVTPAQVLAGNEALKKLLELRESL